MSDHLVRALLGPEGPRAVACLTTETCRTAARLHRLVGAAADALGRMLTSSALMATLTKGEERITVRLSGCGPMAVLTSEADAHGMLRAYPTWRRKIAAPTGSTAPARSAEPQQPPSEDAEFGTKVPDSAEGLSAQSFTVEQLVGTQGQVTVLRDLGLKEIYQGQSALVCGEIDRDLETYLNTSEQLPSVLRCRAHTDAAGHVVAAGGVLLQHMPSGEPALERYRAAVDGGLLDRLLGQGLTAEAFLSELKGRKIDLLEWRNLRLHCPCSRQRAGRALVACGPEEIHDILTKEGSTTLTCHFCTRQWRFESSDLVRLLQEARGPGTSLPH